MKKKIIAVLSVVLGLSLCVSLAACKKKSNGNNNDKHVAAAEWSKDETKHWHACATKGHTDKLDEAAHTEQWVTKTEADYGVDKVEKKVCSVCAYEFGEDRTVENSALAAKDNAITVGTIDFTYNAKSQPVDSLVTAGNKEGMVIKYVGVDGTTYEESTTAPTNAGTYQYAITVPATAEWKAAEKTGKFTIEKYELTELYEKTHTKDYSGTLGITVKVNPFDDEEVSVNIAMKKADAGTKEIGRVWVVGVTNSNNYTIDQSKVRAEIVAKKLSGLNLSVNEADIDKEQDVCKIEREITGANNEKLIVMIEFRWVDLDNEDELEFKTTLPAEGAGGCKISLKVANANYEFYGNIGTLTLVRETA